MEICKKCDYIMTDPVAKCPQCGTIVSGGTSEQESAREALLSGRYDDKSRRRWSESRVNAEGWICANCGTVGFFSTTDKGNSTLSCCFYLVAFLPGLIYSAWRESTKKKRCDKCASSDVYEVSTPRGRELMRRYHPNRII